MSRWSALPRRECPQQRTAAEEADVAGEPRLWAGEPGTAFAGERERVVVRSTAWRKSGGPGNSPGGTEEREVLELKRSQHWA